LRNRERGASERHEQEAPMAGLRKILLVDDDDDLRERLASSW
jgi:hypothetical protein